MNATRSNGGVALPHQPGRVGQGTAIEQSRAGAEVYAAVLVAQQCPRNTQGAITAMRESCSMLALAERSSFRFSRGGGTVSGPSVHLARELARCWGNIQYGVAELRRDDEHGQSEMQAFAWDVETNARSAAIFIVPHKRDKRGGAELLTDMRDIYESNANAGARRVRECIFSVLPIWFVEDAKDVCQRTLAAGGGKPLAQRVADAIARFAALGISEERLAEKLGRPSADWTGDDLAVLTVTYKSLQRGEVTKDEEFPPTTALVTAAEITSRATAPAAQQASADSAPAAPDPGGITAKQRSRLHAMLTKGGIGDDNRQTKLDLLTELTGRPIGTSNDLTHTEADVVNRRIAELEAEAAEHSVTLAEIVAELLDRPTDDAADGGGSS